MLLLCAISLAVGTVVLAFHFWRQFDDSPEAFLWLRNWAIRGMGVPVACWMLFNSGLFKEYFSFLPQLDTLKGLAWLYKYIQITTLGIALISSYWAAATLIALLVAIGATVENYRDFKYTLGIWSVILLPIAALIVKVLGWWGAGLAGVVWLFPVFQSCSQLKPAINKPEYYKALVNLQFGRYEQAEAAVIEQLELNQTDFEGWLMLAELYALHFNDLPAADRTIHEISSDPGTSVSQISMALHKLADWYLKVDQDPVAARRVLEEISKRLPGTHLDRMARLRANQLPKTQKEYQKELEVKRIRLPRINDNLDSYQPAPAGDLESATAQANQLVEKLKSNPNDLESREQLARVFAERLSKVDLAIEQIEQLLALPGIESQKIAQWLNLIAGWHIRIRHDEAAAELTLERVMRLCPNSTEAFTAQRRLNLMRREAKARVVFKPLE